MKLVKVPCWPVVNAGPDSALQYLQGTALGQEPGPSYLEGSGQEIQFPHLGLERRNERLELELVSPHWGSFPFEPRWGHVLWAPHEP
jgi:hypothetical protein